MKQRQNKLIKEAKAKHGQIYPCIGKATLYDCFTIENNKLIIWYNTKDKSTHMIKEI